MPQEFITEKQEAFPVPLAELLEEGKVADRHGFLEMTDFPLDDPWSCWLREVISDVSQQELFTQTGTGIDVWEIGAGDARNFFALEPTARIKNIFCIDIDLWRLTVAKHNLATYDPDSKEFIHSEAATYFKKLRDQTVSGLAIICLPQSPQGESSADAYDSEAETLRPYIPEWNRFGLSLNAAVLDKLRRVAADNLQLLLTLSHRVPPIIRDRLITETGWEIIHQFRTPYPIQQDPDTPIAWVCEFDDGQRFYQQVEADGTHLMFEPISAAEAENRRIEAIARGIDRDGLNVYHYLTVYQLMPDQNDFQLDTRVANEV